MGSRFFFLFVGGEKKWTLAPLLYILEEDMFEETAMERQGRSPGAGAKRIQMSEHVHKVEPSCTVVVFPCSRLQSLLFISFFLAVSHFPALFLRSSLPNHARVCVCVCRPSGVLFADLTVVSEKRCIKPSCLLKNSLRLEKTLVWASFTFALYPPAPLTHTPPPHPALRKITPWYF